MPSTYSPSLRIELIGAGEQSGTWGSTTNTNLGTLLEQSIAGVQAITMIDANYTLTNYNGVSDEARKAVLVASGTNTAARDIIAPLVAKNYIIKNNTTGGFAINIRAATGASVSIPNGVTSAVYCDGTDFNLALTQTLIAAGVGISIATVGATSTITNTSNFVSGTRMPFAQAAAPTGWTQDTSDNANNRMLRVVNTAGNGVGGSSSPILNNVVSSHTHTFTGNALGNHTHTDSGHTHIVYAIYSGGAEGGGGSPTPASSNFNQNTSTSSANISSNSAGTPSGSISANGSASDWTPRYIDMIICSKN
jgi:hypothetical protein